MNMVETGRLESLRFCVDGNVMVNYYRIAKARVAAGITILTSCSVCEIGETDLIIGYARVSGHEQKKDLK
jgi:predicted site-specific integrase-resolvase